jgi:hypothetical protein
MTKSVPAQGKDAPDPLAPVSETKKSGNGAVPEASRTIKLDFPIEFAGQRYEQLVVRRLKAKDFRMLDTIEGGGNAAAIQMTALICGVDEAIIDELDASDYVKLQEAIADFFPRAMADRLSTAAAS